MPRKPDKPLEGQLRLPLGVPKVHSIQREYRSCGDPRCGTCGGTARKHGPYLYAAWRADGKVHRKYLGLG